MTLLFGIALCLLFLLLWVLWKARYHRRVDWNDPVLNFLDGLNRYYCCSFHRLSKFEDRSSTGDQQILVSNHISGLDPLLLAAWSSRPLRFLVAREEYERWWLHPLLRKMQCIPVDRQQAGPKSFLATRRILRQGERVAVFPQGGIQHPTEQAKTLKNGAQLLAHSSGFSLLPIRVSGIRCQGSTFLALLLRSQARLEVFEAIPGRDASSEQAQIHIAVSLGL